MKKLQYNKFKKGCKMRVLALAAGLLMVSANCSAWMVSLNPDKYPSIGIGFNRVTFDNKLTQDSYWGEASQSGDTELDSISLNLRLPVDDSLTISFNYAAYNGKGTYPETFDFYGSSLVQSGHSFGVSLRVYLGQ